MILSRLRINPRSRQAMRDLADCQELHRTILSAFPVVNSNAPREQFEILYRIEYQGGAGAAPTVLVQSHEMPNWQALPPQYLSLPPESKDISQVWSRLQPGVILRFRLRANPTRKIGTKSADDGAKSNGRRVELRTEEQRTNWLRRKGTHAGFEIVSVRAAADVPDLRIDDEGKVSGFRMSGSENSNRQLIFASALFEGRLRVIDADKFRSALERGIGSAKAYGFGLLSIAPL